MMLHMLIAFLCLAVVAVAETAEFSLDPVPGVEGLEEPRLNPGSSVNPRNLRFIFARQGTGECSTAAGVRFGCAPNFCCNGEANMGCCYTGQNCLTINGNHACCPTNYQTYGNTLCTYGNSTCCSNQPGKACGPSQTCCDNGECCEVGYTCCTGSGGTKCCQNLDSQCCGGVCCPTTQDCCGDVCCDVGWACQSSGTCVKKTSAAKTVTTTATSIVKAGSTNVAAALEGRFGEKVGVLGGLLAAGLL